MLDNTITLSVDKANDATLVDADFRRHSVFDNRSLYIGETHSQIKRETLGFYRTEPKKAGNYRGTAKSAFKFTTDIVVEGVDDTTTLTAPAIAEVSFSFPVGVTTAEMIELRQRLIAVLDDDAFMASLSADLEV